MLLSSSHCWFNHLDINSKAAVLTPNPNPAKRDWGKCREGLRKKITYDKWKALAKEAKEALDGPLSIKSLLTKICYGSTDVKQVYEDSSQYIAPDAVSRRALEYTWDCLEEKDKCQDSHKESQRSSSSSQIPRSASGLTRRSRCSSLSSEKKQETVAKVVATQVLQEMEREKQASLLYLELKCILGDQIVIG